MNTNTHDNEYNYKNKKILNENVGHHKNECFILDIDSVDKINDQYTGNYTWNEELYVQDMNNLNTDLKEFGFDISALDDIHLANPKDPCIYLIRSKVTYKYG